MNKCIMPLIEMCVSKNKSTFHTFVDFSGHTESVSIRVYAQGWSRENPAPTYSETIYVSRLDARAVKRVTKKLSELEAYGQKLIHSEAARKDDEVDRLEKRLAQLKANPASCSF